MIDNLKAFVAVVDANSVTKAASRLCLTQSAVSRRIQQLEEDIGALLLDRSQKPPVPTALGRRAYEKALPILRAVENLLVLGRENALPSGTLRLGVSQAIGDALLAQTVMKIKENFPTLDVRLRSDWSDQLSKHVGNGELDAAITMYPSTSEPEFPLLGKRLARLDVVVVQSRQHPVTWHEVPLAQLSQENWILNPLGCGYRAGLEVAMAAEAGDLRVVVDTYNAESQLQMIASGLGLGLLPRPILQASPSRENISIVRVSDFTMTVDIWLLHLKMSGNLTRARDLLAQTVSREFSIAA